MTSEELRARWRSDGLLGRDTLPQRQARVCAERGDALALIDGDVRLSFADAAASIERLAGWLTTIVDAPGEVVSWQVPNWWEAAVLHHAAVRIGAISNPLPMALREREMRSILSEARPSVLVIPHTYRDFDHLALARRVQAELGIRAIVLVRASPQPRTFDLTKLLATPVPSGPPPMPDDPTQVALLLYTSGTTSNPKGVQHTHESLLCEVDSFTDIHALTPEDRNLGGAPLGHVAGLVYGVLAPFAIGSSTALLERWDPTQAISLIERERVTFMTGPPTFLLGLAQHAAGRDVASFRLFSTGGASIPAAAVREAGEVLGCVVKRAYGSTELPTLTGSRVEDAEHVRLESDGRPLGGAEIRIVNAAGDAPRGQEGEIVARSPEMFVGYHKAPNPGTDAEGWFATGDVGLIDGDGLLHVTGRIKDIIIRGGENISAAELEDLIQAHPAVAEVAVVGVPDARLGERACAVVVAVSSLTLEDLAAFLIERGIAKHKLPERLELREELPKTESGKVRKDALRAALS